MKKKILFILRLPPPVHGASMASQYIFESASINETFSTDYINIMTAGSLADSGKGSIRKFFLIMSMLRKITVSLLHTKYDLCYVALNSQGWTFYKDFLIVVLLKLFRKKIIYHFHNKGVASASTNVINRFLYRITFNNTNSILLTTNVYYDIMMYVDIKNVFYCANGIPLIPESIKLAEEQKGAPCRLLFLSNMIREKGVFVLLEACMLLKEKYALSFECHFVGAWSNITEEEFKAKVVEYKLESIVLAHGKKYGNDKDKFFRSADIFVFPTFYHNEVLPIVILEAMQFKLPVVSTPVGGVPDQVTDGVTGYLVAQQDVSALANKLKVLISSPHMRRQMGDLGHQHFNKNFTLANYENNLTRIFEEVMY